MGLGAFGNGTGQVSLALARTKAGGGNLASEFKAQRIWDSKQAMYRRALHLRRQAMALLGPISDDGGQPKEVRRATAELVAT